MAIAGEIEVQGQESAAATTTAVSLRLFGALRIELVRGETLEISNRRAAALLAALCLEPGHSIDRETLCRLLWPDRFAAQAKASLRQCLHDLLRQLRDHDIDLLEVTRSTVALRQEAWASDLSDLEALLATPHDEDLRAIAETLLAIGNRPLLEGFALGPAFDGWLALRRKHVDARIRASILALLEARDGQPGHDRLRHAARARFPGLAEPAAGLGTATLAVLPFVPTNPDGDDVVLADGITDELASQLGRTSGLALAGRSSVRSVAEHGGLLTDMAAALRVSHLVEGEVRGSADRFTVRIALIEGASGTEIWSDRLDGSLTEFFDARKVIGANVIAAICRALAVAVTPAPMRRMTGNREAYALYLQGRSLIQRSLQEGAAAKAVELLEKSLVIDPEFAECWTALADAHIHNAVYTPCLDRVERSEMAAECARRAVELDPAQGHALAIAGIHEWTRRNPAGAIDLAYEAYAREPHNADVASRLGSFLLYAGRTRAALPFIEAAVERDPVYGRNYAMLATGLFNIGRHEEAIAAGKRMVDLGMPGMWLAVMQAALGDHERARETYYASRMLMNTVILPPAGTQPMNDEARDAYWGLAAKGCCSGRQEDRAAYCAMLSGLHATMPDPHDPSIAFPAIWMGHADLVMKIYSERIHPANMFGLMSLWADVDPSRRTREDPRFMDFAQDIGLVEAWNRHGWPDLLPSDPRTG